MSISNECEHQYIPGYSIRVPQPFFRSVKCDNCNQDITLTFGWRLVFFIVQFGGFMLALAVANNIIVLINFELSSVSFLVEVVIVIIIYYCVELFAGKLLEHANWILKK